MIPLTQGTWRSDDYINVLRLVNICYLSMERVVELFIYTLDSQYKCAQPHLLLQSRYTSPTSHFLILHLFTLLHWQFFLKKLIDAYTCLFCLCYFHPHLFHTSHFTHSVVLILT